MTFLHAATHAHGAALALDALKDGALDALLSLPILFLAYLLMELLERSEKFNERILNGYSRKAGPALGGLLGIVPQCGISGAAASLFSTGSITVGTMLAVFFATSDEMLPIMLSSLTERGSIGLRSIVLIVLALRWAILPTRFWANGCAAARISTVSVSVSTVPATRRRAMSSSPL